MIAVLAILGHDFMSEDGRPLSYSRKAIVIMAVLVHDIMYEDGHSVMAALVHRAR